MFRPHLLAVSLMDALPGARQRGVRLGMLLHHILYHADTMSRLRAEGWSEIPHVNHRVCDRCATEIRGCSGVRVSAKPGRQ